MSPQEKGSDKITPFVFSATGTGGWESAIQNTLSPGAHSVTFKCRAERHSLWPLQTTSPLALFDHMGVPQKVKMTDAIRSSHRNYLCLHEPGLVSRSVLI